ncbi:MAG TPA: beta-ketoacyl-ACP synthase II [Pseudonocardia sp.]|nr:beta-ketoacyl-ACP synthase II [Pseudonocardia sp.]
MAHDPARRVPRAVVTGRGAVTPVGLTWSETWRSLAAGVSGIRELTGVDTAELPVRIGGEVHGFDAEHALPARLVRRTDPSVHLALVAALEAVEDAKLDMRVTPADRVAVVLGSAGGPTKTSITATRALAERGPARVSPFFFPASGIDSAASEVALLLGAQGPATCVTTACATGATAIGEAARLIAVGEADVVVAGGTDDTLTRLDIAGAAATRALSRRNDDPARACRPFDRDRDGFVMSAGAGVLVLESDEHALARGAHVHGEIAGYGATTDAYHVTAPDPEGRPAQRAMHLALERAGLGPDAVGHISAHGTSTRLNDTTEVQAIRTVFGARATQIPVSSIKSMTGHMLGGAGAVEAIAAVEVLETGIVPPTLNCDDPEDPEMNFVAHTAQRHDVDVVMSNSFGFGGHNAVLVLRKWCG